MSRLLFAILLACTAVFSQTEVDPAKFPKGVKRLLERREGEREIRCDVLPIRPRLNFGFRFQAGYIVRVPLNQYSGAGHSWAVVTKITPENGDRKPVYLVSVMKLPVIPKTTNVGSQVGGGYLLGEGRYRVEWTLVDDTERVCRKDWDVNVALNRSERKVKVAMPANTVAEISLRGLTSAIQGKDDVRPVRITVLLHAAPLFPRRTKMRAGDTLLLLSSLSSLLERLPVRSLRLVVFNLDQQNELFRQDGFAPEELDRVAQSMNQQELGLVDYHVLQNRRGHIDLLADLLNQELAANDPADVVLFMGPMARLYDKLPQTALQEVQGEKPRFFYFQFNPFPRRSADVPDSIQSAIGKLKGKTVIIHSPGEFAKAIDQLENRVAAGK